MTANKRIFINVIATYGRSLYALVIGLLCGRWTLMALGEVDYGLLGLVGGLTAFVVFINNIMSSGVGRYFSLCIGEEQVDYQLGLRRCREWFTLAVVIHITVPLVLMIIGYPVGSYLVRNYLVIPCDRVCDCIWVWRFSCFSCFVGMVSVPFMAMYNAKQEIAELTIYSFATTTLNALFLYYVIQHPGVWLLRYALWSCGLGMVPAGIIVWRALVRYKECRLVRVDGGSLSKLRDMLSFSGWITIGTFADVLKNQGVSVLVNKIFGPAMNAANAIGGTVAAHCSTLSGSLIGAFWPVITSSYGSKDYERAKLLAFRMTKISALAVLLFAVPLTLEVDEVLLLWLKNPPAYSAGLCQLVLLVMVLDKLSTGHMILVSAKGRMACYQLVVGGISLMAIPVSLVAVWLTDSVYSVGWALAIVMACQTMGRVVFAKYLVGTSIRQWLNCIVFPILAILLVIAALAFVPMRYFGPSIWRIGVTTMISSTVIVVFSWLYMFDASEKMWVREHMARMLPKR